MAIDVDVRSPVEYQQAIKDRNNRFINVAFTELSMNELKQLMPSSSSSSSSSSLSHVYAQCLRDHHKELVDGVEPADIMDYLFQERLLSLSDMQTITSFPTQIRGMRHLLTVLHRRLVASDPESVFRHFLCSLNTDYSFLEQKLRGTAERLREELQTVETPSREGQNRSGGGAGVGGRLVCTRNPVRSLEAAGNGKKVENSEDCGVLERTCLLEDDLAQNPDDDEVDSLKYPIAESAKSHVDLSGIEPQQCKLATSSALVTSPPSELERTTGVLCRCRRRQFSPSVEYKCHHSCSQVSCSKAPTGERLNRPGVRLSPSSEYYDIKRTMWTFKNDTSVLYFQFSKLFDTGKPLLMPPSNHGKKFKSEYHRKLFDSLSSSVNDQQFSDYDLAKIELSKTARRDPDVMCLILYLDACKSVILSDFDSCKRIIADSLGVATSVSSPNRFYALILSVRVWINLKQRRLGKADQALSEALNVIGQDPVTCSGMLAGWMYVNEAKLLMARMTSSMRHADVFRSRAVAAMEKALEQFKIDDSADGPYGINFASVKLASLLLGCDDSLVLVDLIEPASEDVARADCLLKDVDDSVSGICAILKPLYLIALADQKFRSGNLRRAVQLARDAKDSAHSKWLCEEEDLAEIRCRCYSQKEKDAPGNALVESLKLASIVHSYSSDEADTETPEKAGETRETKKRRRRKRDCFVNPFGLSGQSTSENRNQLALTAFTFFRLIFIVLLIGAVGWSLLV